MQLTLGLVLATLGLLTARAGSDAYGDPLPAGAVARLGSLRFTHPVELRFATLCGEREWIVSGDAGGRLRLWRAATGELVRELDPVGEPLTDGSADPGGERLAVCGASGRLRILSVPGGELLRELPGAGFHVGWSADGQRIAAAGAGSSLMLLDTGVESAEPRLLEGGAYPLSRPTFSADGRLVAAVEINRDVINGRARAVGQAPSSVRVWSVATGEVVVTWPLPGEVASALVPLGQGGFVIGTRSGHLFSAAEAPGVLEELASTAPGSIIDGAPGLDCAWFALGSQGLARLADGGLELFPELACNGVEARGAQDLVLWRAQLFERRVAREAAGEDPAAWVQAPAFERHGAPVSALDISADGALVLTAAHDGVLRLWDVERGVLRLAAHGHEGLLFGCDLSSDAARFASAGRDGTARIWSATTGREQLVLGPFAGAARDVAFDAAGERLAVAVGDGSAWVFDARTGAELWHVEKLAGPDPRLAWSPDGALLAVAGRGLSVRAGETGAERWRLDELGSPVGALAWSPDGAWLALGLARRAVLLVDATRGPELREPGVRESGTRELGPLAGRATGVAFAALDGGGLELLATAHNHLGIRRWDALSGVARGSLTGHAADPLCLAVARDVPRAVTGGADALGLVWALVP